MNLSALSALLAGKRTYLVALGALAYLLWCQVTHRTPDESILAVFGALGLGALRAGLATSVRAVLREELDPQPRPTDGVTAIADKGPRGCGLMPLLLLGSLPVVCPLLLGCALHRPSLAEVITTRVTDTNGVVSTSTHERRLKVTTAALWPASTEVSKTRSSLGKTLSTGANEIAEDAVGGTNGVAALRVIDSILGKVRP